MTRFGRIRAVSAVHHCFLIITRASCAVHKRVTLSRLSSLARQAPTGNRVSRQPRESPTVPVSDSTEAADNTAVSAHPTPQRIAARPLDAGLPWLAGLHRLAGCCAHDALALDRHPGGLAERRHKGRGDAGREAVQDGREAPEDLASVRDDLVRSRVDLSLGDVLVEGNDVPVGLRGARGGDIRRRGGRSGLSVRAGWRATGGTGARQSTSSACRTVSVVLGCAMLAAAKASATRRNFAAPAISLLKRWPSFRRSCGGGRNAPT